MRIALLICDTPVPAVVETRGTYLEIYRDFLRRSNPSASFELDGYDVVRAQAYPDLNSEPSYQGIVITGSGAPDIAAGYCP